MTSVDRQHQWMDNANVWTKSMDANTNVWTTSMYGKHQWTYIINRWKLSMDGQHQCVGCIKPV